MNSYPNNTEAQNEQDKKDYRELVRSMGRKQQIEQTDNRLQRMATMLDIILKNSKKSYSEYELIIDNIPLALVVRKDSSSTGIRVEISSNKKNINTFVIEFDKTSDKYLIAVLDFDDKGNYSWRRNTTNPVSSLMYANSVVDVVPEVEEWENMITALLKQIIQPNNLTNIQKKVA